MKQAGLGAHSISRSSYAPHLSLRHSVDVVARLVEDDVGVDGRAPVDQDLLVLDGGVSATDDSLERVDKRFVSFVM